MKMACCCGEKKDYIKRHIDRWSGDKKKCHHIGIKVLRRSRPLQDLNKSTTAAASSVAAADSSSSSKDAATVLDLSPVNLVKCSTSTAAPAKTLPVKKKKKKKRPKFGEMGKKNNKKKEDVLP